MNTVDEYVTSSGSVETNLEVSWETKNRTTMWSIYFTSGYIPQGIKSEFNRDTFITNFLCVFLILTLYSLQVSCF